MRKYNLKRDRTTSFVHRKCLSKPSLAPLPASIDLRNKFKSIYDQGSLGSCTANAGAAAYRFVNHNFNPSRLFLYYNERLLDDDIKNDSGSSLSQCINALKQYGICSENLCPYEIEKFDIEPTKESYDEATHNKVVKASRLVQTKRALKECLVSGKCFILGIAVYHSFESENVAKTGVVPMPAKDEQLLGYHAVTCVGYSNEQKHWIMLNSWGQNWGASGFFYLPYDYLTEENLASDMWTINQVTKTTQEDTKTKA